MNGKAVGLIGGAEPFMAFFEGLIGAGSTDATFVIETLVLWFSPLAVPCSGSSSAYAMWPPSGSCCGIGPSWVAGSRSELMA